MASLALLLNEHGNNVESSLSTGNADSTGQDSTKPLQAAQLDLSDTLENVTGSKNEDKETLRDEDGVTKDGSPMPPNWIDSIAVVEGESLQDENMCKEGDLSMLEAQTGESVQQTQQPSSAITFFVNEMSTTPVTNGFATDSQDIESPSKASGGRNNYYVPSRELRDLLDSSTAANTSANNRQTVIIENASDNAGLGEPAGLGECADPEVNHQVKSIAASQPIKKSSLSVPAKKKPDKATNGTKEPSNAKLKDSIPQAKPKSKSKVKSTIPISEEAAARAAALSAAKSIASKAAWARKRAALAASANEGRPVQLAAASTGSSKSKSKVKSGLSKSVVAPTRQTPVSLTSQARDVAKRAASVEPIREKASTSLQHTIANAESQRQAEQEQDEDEEPDDRLYCICQELYDPERLMIACDRCDSWYHTNCINIKESEIVLIGHLICPNCENETEQRTSYKTACAREGCNNAALKLSKYCSDWCGTTVAASRLERQPEKPNLDLLWGQVEGLRKKEAIVTAVLPNLSASIEEPNAQARNIGHDDDARKSILLQKSLADLVSRRTTIENTLSLVNSRLAYLVLTIKQWEQLCATHSDVNPPQTAKKPKSSKSSQSTSEAPCGFDVRLVWDDSDFEAWLTSEKGGLVMLGLQLNDSPDEGEEEGMVCLLTRRKCDRHTGWQKMREADYEVEKSSLTRRLDQLAEYERRLRRYIEDFTDLSRWHADRNRKALARADANRVVVKMET